VETIAGQSREKNKLILEIKSKRDMMEKKITAIRLEFKLREYLSR
jgi:hypothetical protein